MKKLLIAGCGSLLMLVLAAIATLLLYRTSASCDIGDIGLQLLTGEELVPIQSGSAIPRKPVPIAPSILDTYSGRYQIDDRNLIAIWREGDRLFLQITRQPRFALQAESSERFFLTQPRAEVVFIGDSEGRITELVLSQSGHEVHCRRLPALATVAIDPAATATHVGCYRVSPSRRIMVTRVGESLFVQPTMRPREELYARSATEYVSPVSDTVVTFFALPDGSAGLRLQQGRDRMDGVKAEEPGDPVMVAPEKLEQLAGVYQHNPDFHLSVIRIGSRLYIQGSNQPMHELAAISDSRFSLATVPPPGLVTFSRDDSGRVVSLTVHAGRETETSRKIR